MNSPFDSARLEQTNLREHYDNVATNTLRSILRYKVLIVALVIGSLAVSGFVVSQLPRKYTAEALVQPEFLFGTQGGSQTGSNASVSGASLVASEARIIQSHSMVRRVIRRLQTDKDLNVLAKARQSGGTLDIIRSHLFPETYSADSTDMVTSTVLRRLSVTHDPRSYVISLAYTTDDPKAAAAIANAFALEYFRTKRSQKLREKVVSASGKLAQMLAIYGAKHPNLVRALAELNAAQSDSRVMMELSLANEMDLAADNGISLAQPINIPTHPKGRLILGLTAVLATILGVVLAIFLEPRTTGFRNSEEVFAYTGYRCLTMLPPLGDTRKQVTSIEVGESLHSLSIEAGLIDSDKDPKVVMIACSVPNESASRFAEALTYELNSANTRVLTIVPSSPNKTASAATDGLTEIELSDNDLTDIDNLLAIFNRQLYQTLITRLPTEPDNVNGGKFARYVTDILKIARSQFDVVLVVTPPVLLFADALLIGKETDLTFYVAKWNATPRKIVEAGLRRLDNRQLSIAGVILTDVDPAQYRERELHDTLSILSRYEKKLS